MSNSSIRLSIFLLLPSFVFFGCTLQDDLTDISNAGDSVTIAYAEPISSYSPLSYEAKNRKYLTNIYEPLVRYDATFNFESGLSVSWGRLNETTWDFKLRQDVFFHDGTSFDSDDVLYSLELARQDDNSELGSLLSTIVSVTKTEDHRVEVVTSRPDPLLLNKLTYVYMIPSGYENFDLPVGTGPYRTAQFVDDTLVLERFDEYWGPVAYFKEARLQYIADPEERLLAILSGEVDVLANVPPQSVTDLEAAGIEVEDFPSLEVSFLMLNERGPFVDANLRAAVWNALSTDYVDQFGGGYLMKTSQVAATGITGYDPQIEMRAKDLDAARSYRNLLADEVNLTLDIPQGLEVLGQAIQEDLAAINITVTVNAIEPADYEEVIMAGISDFYFFGWKYDLADSEDFFANIVHTPTGTYGEFNALGYSNPEVDAKIEEASMVFDPTQRRLLFGELSSQLLKDGVVIPLFEAQVLYALSTELYYDFRLDGQIWASEIVENVVK